MMHWTTGLLLNAIGFDALSSATARSMTHVWFWWGWDGGKDVIICFYWAQNGGGWINERESLRLFECLMIFALGWLTFCVWEKISHRDSDNKSFVFENSKSKVESYRGNGNRRKKKREWSRGMYILKENHVACFHWLA